MSDIEDTKTCPYCAETIKAAAVVCRYCGRDLPKAPEMLPIPPQPVESDAPPTAVEVEPAAVAVEPAAAPAEENLPLLKSAWLVLTRPTPATFRRIMQAKSIQVSASLFWIGLGSLVSLLLILLVLFISNAQEARSITGDNFIAVTLATAVLFPVILLVIILMNPLMGGIIKTTARIFKQTIDFKHIMALLGSLSLAGNILFCSLLLSIPAVWVRLSGDLADNIRQLLFLAAVLYWLVINAIGLKVGSRLNAWQFALLLLAVLIILAVLSPIILPLLGGVGLLFTSLFTK